jgi:hypothetical protein
MHCVACDCELKDSETRRKTLFTKEYVDMCDNCFETIADDVPLSSGNDELDEQLIEDYAHDNTDLLDKV